MIKKYLYYIIPIALLLVFLGVKLFPSVGIEGITTTQLSEMLNEDQGEDIFYVDVREAHEFREEHIKEMINVPLSQLESDYEIIPTDKTVVIICRSGNRSLQAANILTDLGYQDIINVKGGMLAWEGEVTK